MKPSIVFLPTSTQHTETTTASIHFSFSFPHSINFLSWAFPSFLSRLVTITSVLLSWNFAIGKGFSAVINISKLFPSPSLKVSRCFPARLEVKISVKVAGRGSFSSVQENFIEEQHGWVHSETIKFLLAKKGSERRKVLLHKEAFINDVEIVHSPLHSPFTPLFTPPFTPPFTPRSLPLHSLFTRPSLPFTPATTPWLPLHPIHPLPFPRFPFAAKVRYVVYECSLKAFWSTKLRTFSCESGMAGRADILCCCESVSRDR